MGWFQVAAPTTIRSWNVAYKHLDLNNDDVVPFMEWYKVQLDEVELLSSEEIIDTMIDVIRRPYQYNYKYQEFRQMELVV